jgi:hypothetical protein
VRSLVGLIPLLAVETIEPELLKHVPQFRARLEWFLANRPELASLISRWFEPGLGERRLLALVRGHRMKCLLRRMLDPDEFLSHFGVRSVSRYHLDHRYVQGSWRRSFRDWLRAWRVDDRPVRRQFQLARASVVPD